MGEKLIFSEALPEAIDVTVRLLERMRDVSSKVGSKFVVMSNSAYGLWDEFSYEDFVSELKKKKFIVLDLEKLPGFDPSSMTLPGDAHWNKKGHAFVAESLLELIKQEGLL